MAHIRRKLAKTKQHEDDILALLEKEPKNKFHIFAMDFQEAWLKHKDFVLEEWIREYPGTRPKAWWMYEAAKQPKGTYPDCYYDGLWPIPRKRLGGTGSIFNDHDCSSSYGIPSDWVTEWQVEYYNGRAKDNDGNFLERGAWYDYNDGDFKKVAVDPNDPPVYESQAAYLKRHKLFMDGEEERLTQKDFKPNICDYDIK